MGGLFPQAPTNTVSRVTAAKLGAYVFPRGSIVFAKVGAALLLGRIATLSSPSCIDNNMMGFVIDESRCDGEFVRYAMSLVRFDLLANPGAVPSVGEAQIGHFALALPSMEEQRAIAAFLDRRTAQIDTLIAKYERLLELLDEKRQAVMQAVIWRDVSSAVPLKFRTDERRPIMYGIVLPGPDVADGVPIVKGGDVAARRLSPEQLNRTTREIEAPYARSRLAIGDLVFAIRGGIGDVELVPTELVGANITQDVARIAPASDVCPTWLTMVLRTPGVGAQVSALTTGATVRGLNIRDLKLVGVPDSDRSRQDEDLRTLLPLEEKTTAVQRRLSHARDLLFEYRSALITAAVTGHMDVTKEVDNA